MPAGIPNFRITRRSQTPSAPVGLADELLADAVRSLGTGAGRLASNLQQRDNARAREAAAQRKIKEQEAEKLRKAEGREAGSSAMLEDGTAINEIQHSNLSDEDKTAKIKSLIDGRVSRLKKSDYPEAAVNYKTQAYNRELSRRVGVSGVEAKAKEAVKSAASKKATDKIYLDVSREFELAASRIDDKNIGAFEDLIDRFDRQCQKSLNETDATLADIGSVCTRLDELMVKEEVRRFKTSGGKRAQSISEGYAGAKISSFREFIEGVPDALPSADFKGQALEFLKIIDDEMVGDKIYLTKDIGNVLKAGEYLINEEVERREGREKRMKRGADSRKTNHKIQSGIENIQMNPQDEAEIKAEMIAGIVADTTKTEAEAKSMVEAKMQEADNNLIPSAFEDILNGDNLALGTKKRIEKLHPKTSALFANLIEARDAGEVGVVENLLAGLQQELPSELRDVVIASGDKLVKRLQNDRIGVRAVANGFKPPETPEEVHLVSAALGIRGLDPKRQNDFEKTFFDRNTSEEERNRIIGVYEALADGDEVGMLPVIIRGINNPKAAAAVSVYMNWVNSDKAAGETAGKIIKAHRTELAEHVKDDFQFAYKNLDEAVSQLHNRASFVEFASIVASQTGELPLEILGRLFNGHTVWAGQSVLVGEGMTELSFAQAFPKRARGDVEITEDTNGVPRYRRSANDNRAVYAEDEILDAILDKRDYITPLPFNPVRSGPFTLRGVGPGVSGLVPRLVKGNTYRLFQKNGMPAMYVLNAEMVDGEMQVDRVPAQVKYEAAGFREHIPESRLPKGQTIGDPLTTGRNIEVAGKARIIDGDTLEVNGERVRFVDVNAPEMDTEEGRRKKDELVEKLKNRKVRCVLYRKEGSREGTEDGAGRWLGRCYPADEQLGF